MRIQNTTTTTAMTLMALMLSGGMACTNELGSDEEPEFILDAVAVIDEGVIVGDIDWIEASTLGAGAARTAANAAGYVSIPQQSSRCSGFLIARDVVMTNHHCIPDAESARGVTVNFRYESRWDSTGVVRCDRFIGANESLDYALVGCEGFPGDTYGILDLDGRALPSGTAISLLHQNCDYFTTPSCAPTKKVSPGRITGTFGSNRVSHNADMLGGSSGGAIVAEGTSSVVAINNAHVVTGTSNGRGTTNIGVPMSLIIPDMRTRFPDVFGACDTIGSAGRTIDEDDDCTTLGGQARYWRAISGRGHDGDFVWTGTTNSSASSNFAEWDLRFDVAGRYELAVAIDATTATATRARYSITHAGRTDDVVVNQAAVSSSGFVSLGSFDFAAGGQQRVRLNDNTGDRSQQLVVDGLRIRPATTTPEPTPEPEPEPEPTPEPAPTCSEVMVVNASALNVRATPNTSRSPIGTLSGGDVVARLQSVSGQQVGSTNTWYLVEGEGLRGYISAAYAACQ